MHTLKDNYNRYFSYLRLSITEACNFRCNYCMPASFKTSDKNKLSLNEIYNLVTAFTELGVNKIRLTGGEPTTRKDFIHIAKMISSFSAIKSLVFTTNGYKLTDLITNLLDCGFTGINISLDTLNKEKFSIITHRNYFDKVYEGILRILTLNLDIKINVVLSDLFSFDDFENFYSLTKYKNLTIRFINQMETNFVKKKKNRSIDVNYILTFLKKNNWTLTNEKFISAGPALTLINKNFMGKIGIINPYSNSFCLSCNRLRISSQGNLHLCLFGGKSYSIRHFLDSKTKKFLLQKFLIETTKIKGYSHFLDYKNFGELTTFSSIGG
ncbi:MAG TPA: radical SAM protein [Candidatus Azoamicus sp. OHIO2]